MRNKNIINSKIKELLKQCDILNIKELNDCIYVFYTNDSNKNNFSDNGPLYINKETLEHEFLSVDDFSKNHLNEKKFPELIENVKLNTQEIVLKIRQKKKVEQMDFFDYFISLNLDRNFSIKTFPEERQKVAHFIADNKNIYVMKVAEKFLKEINANYKYVNDFEIQFHYKL